MIRIPIITMNKKLNLLTCIFLITCIVKTNAAITVSRLISDNMVLQRGVKTNIWGTASASESIQLTFKGKRYQARAGKDGAWSVLLDASTAGGPYILSIKGKSGALEIKNLLVGDVWVCSGQSNMQFTVSGATNAAAEIAAANDAGIRQFKVPNLNGDLPASALVGGEWKESTPATTGDFTAVGYFFAREMRKLHPDVPIGLINASWGGTLIEAWISYEGFGWKDINDLKKFHESEYIRRINLLKERNKWTPTDTDAGIVNGAPAWIGTNYDDSKWMEWNAPGWWYGNGLEFLGGTLWLRKSFDLPADIAAGNIALSLGVFDDRAKVWINGNLIDSANDRSGKQRRYIVQAKYLNTGKNTITLQVGNLDAGGGLVGDKDALKITSNFYQQSLSGLWKYRIGKFEYAPQSQPQTTPTGLYNGMIAPLTQYTIGGALWYQGEGNASDIANAYKYRDLLNTLVTNWRDRFHSGVFPFVVVQLPNFQKPAVTPVPSNWAVMRESQSLVLTLPNTALICTIDLGDADNIHPTNKQEVGKRTALAVRKLVFKEKGLDTGPVYQSMKVTGDSIRIIFSSTAKELVTKDKYGYVTGFTIAGADKKFVWAKAKIEGKQVVVWSDQVKAPVSVRYGWANNPADADLYSSNNQLPLVPFRTDNWDANL
jgi:sialate O-acetylesterase